MKHVTYSDKSLLLGDEAADLLIEYAAVLGRARSADRVDMNAISSDGDDVVATFLVDGAAPLMAETAHSSLPEPDNAKALAYIRERIRIIKDPPAALPLTEDDERVLKLYNDDLDDHNGQ